jgi:septal ring-binding cell division protein DamX
VSARSRLLSRAALACGLGVSAALLVSCGTASTKGLLPTASAEPLQSDFESVSQAAAAGNGSCTATEAAISKTESDYRAMPASVDSGLRGRLREGIEALRTQALTQCAQPASTSTSSTAKTTTTNTATTNTATTPTQTETTTTQTETTPTTTNPPTGPGGGIEAPKEGGSGQGNGEGNGNGRSGGVGPGGD